MPSIRRGRAARRPVPPPTRSATSSAPRSRRPTRSDPREPSRRGGDNGGEEGRRAPMSSASMKAAVAHYWVRHCEHCRPFATVREAYEFLRAGAAAHEMAVDKVTGTDGRLLLSRDDLAMLDRLSRTEQGIWLDAAERILAVGGLPEPPPPRNGWTAQSESEWSRR